MARWMTRRTHKRVNKLISVCIVMSSTSWLLVMIEIQYPSGSTKESIEQLKVKIDDVREVPAIRASPAPTHKAKESKPELHPSVRQGLKVEDILWIKPFLDDAVINPHDFEYLINPTHVCKQAVFLIIYVHTHPANSDRRTTIRKTWGNPENFPDTPFKIIFVVGHNPGKEEQQDRIQLESMEYEDIVQENFIDAYENMTLKAVASLKWISRYCSHAKFILKTDDDAFINMYPLLKHLKELDYTGNYNQNLLMCRVWWKMDVYRDGRWKVPEHVIPDKYYPPYCSGIMYVMSMDVGLVLYRMSLSIKPFWVDDVYITGLIPQRVGIKHSDFIWAYVPMNLMEEYYSKTEWYKYVFTHINNMTLLTQTWKKVQGYAMNSKIPDMKVIQPGKIAENYTKKAPKHDPKKFVPMKEVVNPHNFKLVLEPNAGCGADVFLVIVVHTTPEQAGRRRLARTTWGKEDAVTGLKTKTFFVTGKKSSIVDLQQTLELEADDNGDILQEDYEDKFENLHRKSIGALKWISKKCASAKYVLKVDDNAFVNIFTLLDHLKNLNTIDKYGKNILMCNRLWAQMPVAREGQYRVLEENYPDRYFPPYCSGLGWIMSSDVAKQLVETSSHVLPPFVVDDALVTGFLVKFQTSVTHVDLRHSFVEPKKLVSQVNSASWYKCLFSAIDKLVEAKKLWQNLLERRKSSPIPKVSKVQPGKLY